MDKRLILASQSPRRQAFLAALGLKFEARVPDVDEQAQAGEAPADLVLRLSRLKAAAVAVENPAAITVAADTVVVLDGQILGKPSDGAEAAAMLRSLRGRVHQVYTAVSVGSDSQLSSRLSCSNVWMRDYSDGEIADYVATGDPLDKAGAYAIQHPSFSPVERWEGCYAGIMGMPLGILAELLSAHGVLIPADVITTCEAYSGHCCLRGIPADA